MAASSPREILHKAVWIVCGLHESGKVPLQKLAGPPLRVVLTAWAVFALEEWFDVLWLKIAVVNAVVTERLAALRADHVHWGCPFSWGLKER